MNNTVREIAAAKADAGAGAYLWLHWSGDCILWPTEEDSIEDDGQQAIGRWQLDDDQAAELTTLDVVDDHA
jgi:hypothetical protein